MDRMWVDWNRDKSFEASEEAELSGAPPGRGSMGVSTFTYKVPARGPGGPIHVRVIVAGPRIVFLPSGYMSGVVKVGGSATRIRAVDLSFDGVYRNQGETGIPAYLLLDKAQYGSPQAQTPMPELIQLPDRRFWKPEIARDGTKISFVREHAPSGTLRFGGAVPTGFSLSTRGRPVVVMQRRGTLTLSVGDYIVDEATFTLPDAAGQRWSYAIDGAKVQIAPHADCVLKIGGPLECKLGVEPNGEGYSFLVTVGDRCGAGVGELKDSRGRRPDPPQVEIRDARGNLVKALQLSYG